MAQPGQLGAQFGGDDAIIRRIQDLERQVRELAAANPFAAMGIDPKPDGLIVQGYETVNGPLVVNGVSTFNGAMTINGAAAITGTLSLPAGIIDNDALAAPVKPDSSGLSATNFALTTSVSVLAQQTVSVPAGYTRCLVFNGVSAGAYNNSGNPDSIWVQADINGTPGGGTAQNVANAGYGSASAFAVRTMTGLSGGTISVATKVYTQQYNWAANAANLAHTNALFFFLR